MSRTLIVLATRPEVYTRRARGWNAYLDGTCIIRDSDHPFSDAAKALLRDRIASPEDLIVCRISSMTEQDAMVRSVGQLVKSHA